MGVGGRGHGVGEGGHLARLGGLGGGDLLQGGVLVVREGQWRELVGVQLSHDVTGHVVLIGSGGCPRGLPIY